MVSRFLGVTYNILYINEVNRDAIYCTLLDGDTAGAIYKFHYEDRPYGIEI